ncbi:Rossmann-like and DUF2520 domain-containing protein [Ilumatobacter sp.]|uniref:Rossmann-like and DUF2520 domain-containing protein n=1 Tax=Ilumatobacter sp. TaxID=1967498 RepID=UPI003C3B49B8
MRPSPQSGRSSPACPTRSPASTFESRYLLGDTWPHASTHGPARGSSLLATDPERRCLIVGAGRAGGSFATALDSVGWTVDLVSSRHLDDIDPEALTRASVVLLTVADSAIADVAACLAGRVTDEERVGPAIDGVVAHVSGACGLDVLAPHRRVGSLHPLMSLPDRETGARRLLDRCTFAVDGDPTLTGMVDALGGRPIRIPASDRMLYHATASIAANHLTALCAQVERLAAEVGVPVDAYWALMTTTLENISEVGSTDALTGPAARADWTTVRSHVAALPDDERLLYLVLCERATELAGHVLPDDLRVSD